MNKQFIFKGMESSVAMETYANQLLTKIEDFLKNTLELTLSDTKTKITHLTSNKVSYLGFSISIRPPHSNYTKSFIVKDSLGVIKRGYTNSIIIEAPIDKIINKLIEQGFVVNIPEKFSALVLSIELIHPD